MITAISLGVKGEFEYMYLKLQTIDIVVKNLIYCSLIFTDNCPADFCFTFYDNFLTWEKPGIGRECLFMLLQGVFFFAIVLLTETGILRRIVSIFSSSKPTAVGSQVDLHGQNEDSDVAEESKRINETPLEQIMATDSLILKVLFFYYYINCCGSILFHGDQILCKRRK
jgi:hypothetical protein